MSATMSGPGSAASWWCCAAVRTAIRHHRFHRPLPVRGGPGDYTVDPAPESVPAGYDVAVLATRSIKLDAGEPAQIELVVPANRSIAGTVHTTSATAGTASVTLVEPAAAAESTTMATTCFAGSSPARTRSRRRSAAARSAAWVELPVEPLAVRFIDFP